MRLDRGLGHPLAVGQVRQTRGRRVHLRERLRHGEERGFHHHAALSIAAYGFLVAERSPIPPSAPIIRAFAPKLATACKAYRPRGAAPT